MTIGLFGSSVAVSLATLAGTTFNGADGDLAVSGAKDWNSFTNATTAAATNFAQQGDGGFAYAGGMKHDTACPTLVGEGTHNKSDFTRMYIAYEELNNETYLYLAWQRIPQNTDTNSAHASFIFAQAEGDCGNDVTPERSEDDLLVTYDFQGGSTGVATIGLSRWVTSGAASQCETSKTVPCWGDVDILTSAEGEGSVNHRTQNSAECVAAVNPTGAVLDEIQNPDQCLGTVEFGEASINLTDTGVFDSATECVSFGSVHVGSRASGNSFDAQLKDLIAPLPINLSNCAGIQITKTDSAGNPLAGVTFTLHEDNNNAPGAATTFSCTTATNGVCTISDVFVGTYWIVETNLPSGYDPDPDLPLKITIDADDVDTVVPFTFVNALQPSDIEITKADDAGNPLAGVTFQLYANTGGAKGAAIAGKSCTTSSAGTCTISNVDAGTYWIDETDLGAAYAADADLPQQITVAGGGVNLQLSFVNPRLHRVIVLVCHEGTNTLHSSSVSIDNRTAENSLAAGSLTAQQQADLCNLGGASEGGFGHGTIPVSVNIGNH